MSIEIEKPIVENRGNFNPLTSIWIVPFVALLISLWLVYQHYSKLGPKIQIFFKSSDGLSAGHSVVKFRNIPIGKVTNIGLANNDTGVIVTVQMDKSMESYLNEAAKFWVVKPRVDYSGVSGLDTLISGSYIAMYAKSSEETKHNFSGLDIPYRDVNSGSYILMHTTVSRGIRVGTPINYRNMQIGMIEHINLSSDGKSIDIVAFINKKYSHLINSTTKFWLQSLLNIGIRGNRLDLDIAPIVSHLVFGGITFETKTDKKYPNAEPNYFYQLYDNEEQAKGKKLIGYGDMREFIFFFDDDMSGLKQGSAIKFKGFDIGEIVSTEISYSSKKHTIHMVAIGSIDISVFIDKSMSGMDMLEEAVGSGMRAKLTSINPLLNELSVELVFDTKSDTKESLNISEHGYIIFPTSRYKEADLMSELNKFVNKLNSLKLDTLIDETTLLVSGSKKPIKELLSALTETSKKLDKAIDGIGNLVNDNSLAEMPDRVNKAIEELSHTLSTTKKLLKGYKSNSLFGDKVGQMLKEINRSSQETKRLLKKLNRKPNSLIFGD
jgi:paraquat-inducible protein B